MATGLEQSLSDQQKLLQGSNDTLDTTQSILFQQSQGLSQQSQLLRKQEVMLNNLTGADSYCYATVAFLDEDLILLVLNNQGDYPIYDVVVEIHDKDNSTKLEGLSGRALWDALNQNKSRFTFQALGPRAHIILTTIELTKGSKQKKLQLNFFTRYRTFSEDLQLIKVNQNWKIALRVFDTPSTAKTGKPTQTLVKMEIEKEFPTGKDGKVEW